MLRKAAAKALWLTKGAALFGGAVVTLALLFGVASVALGANGGNFILGKNNVATTLTKLTGNVNGSAMQVQNTNAGTDDTALLLNVQPGEAPMRVNSASKVANLNADRLDGKDSTNFFSGKTYRAVGGSPGPGGGNVAIVDVECDPGDKVLGGGSSGGSDPADYLLGSGPPNSNSVGGWRVSIQDNGPAGDALLALAICADFPPLRQPGG